MLTHPHFRYLRRLQMKIIKYMYFVFDTLEICISEINAVVLFYIFVVMV